MASAPPLTADELALWRLCEEVDGVDSLLDFVPLVSPWYRRPEHLRPLAKFFHQAETVGGVRALTSTPPQHGKTESILHWVARFIQRQPRKTVAYVTYEAGLAHSKSKLCRSIAERAGVRLRDDSHAAREWRTVQGGGLIATGIGGPLTGQRVDMLVIDDPVKNRAAAESITQQESALAWARSVAFTRLTPEASVIVNMARWSDGDLIGRLPTETEIAWATLNLEAILDEGTPRERALAEWLKPLVFLREQRRLVGPYDWASLYEGRPQPKDGALFGEPAQFRFVDVAGARFAIACDPAATAKNSADHSAIVVMGAVGDGVDQKAYVLEVWRGQVEIPQLVDQLRKVQNRWRCPIYVESQGAFKAVAQMLRAVGAGSPRRGLDPLRIVEVPALGDKRTRALPVSAAWADGRVLVPAAREPWMPAFLSEVKSFTGRGDKQDDQVDALAYAFNAIDRRAVGIHRGVQRHA